MWPVQPGKEWVKCSMSWLVVSMTSRTVEKWLCSRQCSNREAGGQLRMFLHSWVMVMSKRVGDGTAMMMEEDGGGEAGGCDWDQWKSW